MSNLDPQAVQVASPTAPAPQVTTANANVAAPPKRKRAKKTAEQKKQAKEHTEKMWEAIRLKQESARRDINDLSKEWNRYELCDF